MRFSLNDIHSVRLVFLCLVLWCTQASAGPDELVFIAATNHTMPLARFKDAVMVEGILKDLGDAIAQRTGRQARYLSLPPKRVPIYLADGKADGVCYIAPQWVDGAFHWSRPLIPANGVLVGRSDAPPVDKLADLANTTVGTVAAYRYKSVENALGRHFMRDDAPSQELNVQKLAAGRMQYAITEKITFDYLQRSRPALGLRMLMEFDRFKAQCAFSKASRIPFEEIDRAINGLVEDGSVDRILARYR